MANAINTAFGGADTVKNQTADALDDAARKLRELSMTATGEDVKAVLDDAEAKILRLKGDFGQKIEPVGEFIEEHPLMSIAIAAGAGLLIGALLVRRD